MVSEDHVQDASDLMEMMFGNRQSNKVPVITESRDIGNLSRALLDVAKSARLREGVNLAVVMEESKPLTEQLALLAMECVERLAKANGILSKGTVKAEQAKLVEEPSVQVLKVAINFRKRLKDIIDKAEEESLNV